MKKRGLLGGMIALGLMVLSAWTMGWLGTKDPVIAELEQLRDESINRHEEMTEEQKIASKKEFGKRIRKLPEEQRRQFFESSMPMFMKMAEARIDQFLEMTPKEQVAAMDEKIDEMQTRETKGLGEGNRGERWGKKSAAEVDAWRKKMLDWTTPEQRAKFEIAKQKFNDRLEERGLEPKGGFF